MKQRIADLLNEAVARDPAAMHCLCNKRINCNSSLADHPTIQIGTGAENQPTIGLIGILNGVIGTRADGEGYLAGVYRKGKLAGFILRPDV
jgi:hypothetical protein